MAPDRSGDSRDRPRQQLFPNVKALVAAAYGFFERYNRYPWRILSAIGSKSPAEIT